MTVEEEEEEEAERGPWEEMPRIRRRLEKSLGGTSSFPLRAHARAAAGSVRVRSASRSCERGWCCCC